MMLAVTQALLTNQNRPKVNLKAIKAIVLHWTANTGRGANALANRNYFNTTTRAASAHYIVDDKQIVQCIPDNEVAYHVGAKTYTTVGQSLRVGVLSPNYTTIGIEMCVNSDGNFDKMYQNTVELVASLIKKYGLTVDNIITHNLVTGKDCPHFMIDYKDVEKFRNAVRVIAQPDQTLKPGMTGSIVTTMQKLLFIKGQHIIANGAYDQITLTAVLNFQKQVGLQADGICGPKTWEALRR